MKLKVHLKESIKLMNNMPPLSIDDPIYNRLEFCDEEKTVLRKTAY